jgi:hypothetical protein
VLVATSKDDDCEEVFALLRKYWGKHFALLVTKQSTVVVDLVEESDDDEHKSDGRVGAATATQADDGEDSDVIIDNYAVESCMGPEDQPEDDEIIELDVLHQYFRDTIQDVPIFDDACPGTIEAAPSSSKPAPGSEAAPDSNGPGQSKPDLSVDELARLKFLQMLALISSTCFSVLY